MPLVTLTPEEIAELNAIMPNYHEMQLDGAGDGSSDNIIANNERTNTVSQTTPWTPLFLPLDPDPASDHNGKVSKQMADNGMKPIFVALARRYLAVRNKVLVGSRLLRDQSVSAGIGAKSIGALLQSTSPGHEGVPVDAVIGAVVEILDATPTSGTGLPMVTLGGLGSGQSPAGHRIFGRTVASGSNVNVAFYSAQISSDYSAFATPYVWESGLPTQVHFQYGYRQLLSSLDEHAFRVTFR